MELRPRSVQPLRQWLWEQGITQTEIAARARIHRTDLCKMLNGRLVPSEREAQRIADAVGRPVEELFDAELLERS